jgi:hypothetical protein
VHTARTRLRPILKTSFSFILGVAPLAIATGAGAEMRQSLGTAVLFGMLGVTGFGLQFTPPSTPSFAASAVEAESAPVSSGNMLLGSNRAGRYACRRDRTTMRATREKAAENRARIVETASRLFREKGFDGVGLDAIMNEADLTHGGFYGHFTSKEDLAAEAVARALEQSARLQSRFTNVADLVSDYLSESHFAHRANGCALVALGGDMSRRGERVRSGVTRSAR